MAGSSHLLPDLCQDQEKASQPGAVPWELHASQSCLVPQGFSSCFRARKCPNSIFLQRTLSRTLFLPTKQGRERPLSPLLHPDDSDFGPALCLPLAAPPSAAPAPA